MIGVSPIGSIPSFDVWLTVISQYANSPILTTLITNLFEYLDQTYNLDALFDDIWNIDTARGYGLEVWGRIVGISKSYKKLSTTRNLGFEEATDLNADPFNQTPFYTGPSLADSFSLDDASFRSLILAKAVFNVTDGSIPSINQLMLSLFPNRGNCYVVDGGNMTLAYRFEFPLSDQEFAMLSQSGILPKPTGVRAVISQI
jgi:hypothetical protein